MAYNGWTNYATWNVNLWIDNTYGLYREKRDLIKRLQRPITGCDVEQFYADFLGGSTPDLKRYTVDDGPPNFTEIAEHWEDERQELNT